MGQLKTIIIDDEEKARKNLESLLNEFCKDVEVVAMEDSVEKARKAIDSNDPDLILLDIEMNAETGFDLLEAVEDPKFDIIFITAYHEYAIKAFKFSAVDYLLKPVNIPELQAAIQKVSEKQSSLSSREQLEVFMEHVKPSASRRLNKIALPTMDGLIFIKLEDIIQCKSIDNYTQFYLNNNTKILVSRTIKHYDDLLNDHNFFRVHRSHLINLEHVKRYVKGEGGYTIMSDDSRVVVSRRKKEAFLKIFNSL